MKWNWGHSADGAAGILDAAEDARVSQRSGYRDGVYEPAPAGALQRGYRSATDDGDLTGDSPFRDDPDDSSYVPRRGRSPFQQRLQRLPRSSAGRIVLGSVVFVLLGSIVLGLAAARYYLLHDSRFVLASSDDIQVTGNAHLTRDQVLAVFAGDLERSIFRLSLAERRADIERLPWVDHASVMRLLPGTLRVAVTERTPIAFVRQGTRIGLVDATGVLLDMPAADAGDPSYSFPVLTGIDATQSADTRASRVALYRAFLQALPPTAAASLSEVDLSDPEDVKALLPDGSSDVLVHFGDSRFAARYADFEAHLPEWRRLYPKLASADMRYQGQVVLEMTPGAPATALSDSASASTTTLISAPKAIPASKAPASPKVAVTPPPLTIAATPPAAKPPAPRPVLAKAEVRPVAAVHPAAVHPAIKPHVTRPAPRPASRRLAVSPRASGSSAANERMFKALAEARKRQQTQATGGGR